jgi:peptide/nickel transport system ATP-binding protein
MAMLLISHDLGIIASACERIYVMYAGRAVEWGDTANVFSAPAHPYTRGLLLAAVAARNDRGRFETIGGDVPNLADLPPGCPFAPRCPHAMEVCIREMPAPSHVRAGESHLVRCWLYGSGDGPAPASPARETADA